jgi:enamine deaminase RidA (YjgF/YER057c/UK114 family)
MSIERLHPGRRMSQIVCHGNTIYLCGQIADRRPASVTDQANQIFAKIDDYLRDAGSEKSKLLFVQVWLSDIRYYDEFNAAWDRWIDSANTPGRACCQATLASPDMWVELTATAAR